jgi:hypothetical protein
LAACAGQASPAGNIPAVKTRIQKLDLGIMMTLFILDNSCHHEAVLHKAAGRKCP